MSYQRTYTFVDKVGSRVYHRYVENGEHFTEIVDSFPIHQYLENKQGDHTSLYDDRLKRFTYNSIRDAKEFRERCEATHLRVFGMEDDTQNFIAHAYPHEMKFNREDFKVASIDIEVEHDDGFPEPAEAAHEILTIDMKVFGAPGICFGTLPNPGVEGNYIQCRNERDMLYRFMEHFRNEDIHIFTGWNNYGFDVPYLVNRVNNVCGEGEAAMMSPYYKKSRNCIMPTHNAEGVDSYKILGVTVLDFLQLYKKFNREKQESYKLGDISEVEEVGKKVDFEEYGNNLMRLYRENYKLFLEYNAMDNELVERLDAKKKFVTLAIAIAMLTHSRLSDSMGTVKIWDNLIFHMSLAEGKIVPPKRENERVTFAGGFVKTAVPGLYRWPVTLDLTSLYPSIVRLLNLSPETWVHAPMGGVEMVDKVLDGEVDPRLYTHCDGQELCFAINGSTFRKDKQGVLSKAMAFVFFERKRYKDLMKDENRKVQALTTEMESCQDPDRIRDLRTQIATLKQNVDMLDAFQAAVKVVANGGYGAVGNPNFRYFEPAISEAITTTGQYIIRFISNRLNDHLNEMFETDGFDYVIGSDTDSVMITVEAFVKAIDPTGKIEKKTPQKIVDAINKFCEEDIEVFLAEEYAKMAELLNAFENTLDMKREAICDYGLFRAKKNYVLRVYDMEHVRYAHPKLKIAGLETQRSDKPRICRDAMRDIIEEFFDGSEAALQAKVAAFREKFWSSPLKNIAFPKGVGNMEDYGTANAGTLLYEDIDEDENGLHLLDDPFAEQDRLDADEDEFFMVPSAQGFAKGTPFHVKASITYNRERAKHPQLHAVFEEIKPKNKIKYVYLRMPNPAHNQAIAFVDDLPKEFGLHSYLDLDTQFEKSFLSPVRSLTKLVGWSPEFINTFADLYE